MPLGLVVAFRGVSGWLFAAVSLVLGAGGLLVALRLRGAKTRGNARRMFLASIIYLPLLMAAMVADRPARRPTPSARRRVRAAQPKGLVNRAEAGGTLWASAKGVAAVPRKAVSHSPLSERHMYQAAHQKIAPTTPFAEAQSVPPVGSSQTR